MLGALRLMTVERGIDPRGFALLPFGGAGPLHAAAMARELGIERILCPRASGVLCALGLAAAAPRRDVSRTVMLRGASLTAARLSAERDELIAAVTRRARHARPRALRIRHELRYHGQSFELAVEASEFAGPDALPEADPDALREAFARAHELRYGYRDDSAEVELVNIRVSVWGPAPSLRPLAAAAPRRAAGGEPPGRLRRRARCRPPCSAERRRRVRALQGPALCALAEATLLIPPGWSGEVDEHGTIHLHHATARARAAGAGR